MTAFSVLDLSSIVEGSNAGQALANSLDLARHAEALGYKRFWMAEHHGMAGIASAATAVALAYVAGGTATIRVGAGGIMLPNHSPLVIAEQFGTLNALHPGRIDLGLGRAPGSDMTVARALRRNLDTDPNQFPRDVVELQGYLAGDPQLGIMAVPGAGENVPLYILGSSLFGAQLAAILGLPYAFASHFAPGDLDEAIALYRRNFQPSAQLARPYVMAGFNIFAADTDEEAELLASSMQQAFVALRTGNPRQLPPPVPGYRDTLPPNAVAMLDHVLQASAIGSFDTVQRKVAAFLERTHADELIIACQMFDHEARKRSFSIAMDVHNALADTVAA
ncbi:LLM class flavin-dependent oxidoreductase [Sphingomonas sp. LaA6.9]|uniref:LLM class flavin-dependent oxidoreductase n=1 Tax=Sphingomonas sp. LaA6.9 TaxID=2919914 RepID=UPI001F500B49|nr:LLM class flavin-dependent oxidoreductase [Sphingomonas sp. LaA6.9]MCJ8155957.1 LLM class flavin-dependent oxidoreductase [Sphingomonas sp. LaA6.9]